MLPIVLASSSSYRRALLERLAIPFSCHSPDIDETPKAGETAHALVERLAYEKAKALADAYPNHLLIGSDQVAVLNGQILGKPHTHERALKQLSAASGQCVQFLTGLCLLNSHTGTFQSCVVPFSVHFRDLDKPTLNRYLLKEQPYDCAGSFKAEGLGVSLFTKTEGEDNTSLIGLPLIKLVEMLNQEGIIIP